MGSGASSSQPPEEGSAASSAPPEALDRATAERLAGPTFDADAFTAAARDGVVSREEGIAWLSKSAFEASEAGEGKTIRSKFQEEGAA